MMSIKEAIDTWLSYEDSDRYDEEKVRNVIEARITIKEALRSGYTLCKVDEAMGKMERGLQSCFNKVHCASNYDLLEGQEKAFKYCLDVLKEACNDSGRD